MADDDLYADLPPASKTHNESTDNSSSEKNVSDNSKKRANTSVQAALRKLVQLLKKKSKQVKAASLIKKLLSDPQVVADNNEIFQNAFYDLMITKVESHQTPTLFALTEYSIATLLCDWWSKLKGQHKGSVVENQVIEFVATVHPCLWTDDTYELVTATKKMTAFINSIPTFASGSSNDLARQAVLNATRTLFLRKDKKWARGLVESTIALLTERRLEFTIATDLELLDSWTTALRDSNTGKRKNAASESRRNVVQIDSSGRAVKKNVVGVTNHPLL